VPGATAAARRRVPAVGSLNHSGKQALIPPKNNKSKLIVPTTHVSTN
jgi:hypothetical protein